MFKIRLNNNYYYNRNIRVVSISIYLYVILSCFCDYFIYCIIIAPFDCLIYYYYYPTL